MPINNKDFLRVRAMAGGGGGEPGGGESGGDDHAIEDGLITGTLTEYTNDRVEKVRGYAFYNNTTITKVSFAACTYIASYAFQGAKNLVEIYCPNATFVGQQTFDGCTSLIEVSFPLVPKINSQQTFYMCSSLKVADFGSLSSFGYGRDFSGCSRLKVFILRKSDAICDMGSASALANTPFASGGAGGVCLVPTSRVTSYQTATNWSTLYAAGTCTFLPLEEYTLDGTTTGEIDMAKVEAKLNELYGGATA